MQHTIKRYLDAGLSALPAITAQRRPAVSGWKEYQEQPPAEPLEGGDGVCVICGTVSGNLEMIDFDLAGEAFEGWKRGVPAEIGRRLVVERSQSGGYHVIYRCESTVDGNQKLASREHVTDSADDVVICGKTYRPRKSGDAYGVILTMIETRGEGGLFLCAPSPGYELLQGDIADPPVLTAAERDVLLGAARALNTYHAPPAPEPTVPRILERQASGATPGEAYNASAGAAQCVANMLMGHGWTPCDQDGRRWTRPGKSHGVSASLCGDTGALYVFSSNAAPFEPDTSYSPFAVYAMLEHAADYSAAAARLRADGYGDRPAPVTGVDISAILAIGKDPAPSAIEVAPVLEVGDDNPFDAIRLDEIELEPLNPPLIHGLLREEETMNLIAAPKAGKSWATMAMAIAVATGTRWLGMETEPGRVLHIDNELHRKTLCHRYHEVSDAMGMPADVFMPNITAVSLRGNLVDLGQLTKLFVRYPRKYFSLVIIDALYRALPAGTDENDNAGMAAVYNLIDNYAAATGAAFVLVHHTSKGNQNGRAVTDVGSGAGAQSRATDTHAVLRREEDSEFVMLEWVNRSWPEAKPKRLKFDWPLFREIDISAVTDLAPSPPDTVEEFVDCLFVGDMTQDILTYQAGQIGLSEAKAKKLLAVAQDMGLVERATGEGGKIVYRRTA